MKKILMVVVLVVIITIGFVFFGAHHQTQKTVSTTKPSGSYLALGDSVAAGVGLDDYSDSSACDRTNHSYPNKVAATLNYSLQSVACSGATTQKGLIGSQDVNRLAVAPQMNAVQSTNKPSLITLTIGANDANWTTFIQKCYSGVCGSQADTEAVNAGIAVAAKNLNDALAQIKTTFSSDTPKVIVTGYYTLFAPTPKANCSELTGLDGSEVAWIAQLQASIDKSLKSVVASNSFVTFVPIDFAGHELCSQDPWIQGLGGKAAYHPTDAGQAAIASQVVAALQSTGGTK